MTHASFPLLQTINDPSDLRRAILSPNADGNAFSVRGPVVRDFVLRRLQD